MTAHVHQRTTMPVVEAVMRLAGGVRWPPVGVKDRWPGAVVAACTLLFVVRGRPMQQVSKAYRPLGTAALTTDRRCSSTRCRSGWSAGIDEDRVALA